MLHENFNENEILIKFQTLCNLHDLIFTRFTGENTTVFDYVNFCVFPLSIMMVAVSNIR